ncbi:VirB4 family type IV secretion system protein [Nanoarchaeota archaeon]
MKVVLQKNEVDYVFNEIINFIRKKKIVLPVEFNNFCKDLTDSEILLIKSRLKQQGYVINEDMIEDADGSKPVNEIKDKELLEFLIKPDFVSTEAEVIQVGNQLYRGIVASGFPATVGDNWLGEIVKEKRNIDFSIFIEPSSVKAIEMYLNKQLRKVENDLYKYTQKGVSNPALKARKQQLMEQLNNILTGDYKLYKMSLNIAVKGNTKEEVELLSAKIMNLLHSKGIEAKFTSKYNEQLLKSVIPAGTKHLDSRDILVPGPAAAAAFPFSSQFYDIDEDDGILLGFNNNNIPIAKSIWKLPKYVGAVLGASGSGKSYTSKALIMNDSMVNGTKVFILDPEDEYTDMCENINDSQVIRLHRKSTKVPNILSLMGGSLPDRLVSLPTVFDVLLGGLTEAQKPLLENSIIDTYKAKGITETDEKSWKKLPPRLSDLVTMLRKHLKQCSDPKLKGDYELMISKLTRFTTGIFRFMNTSGEGIDPKAMFNVIEFKSMPEEVRPALMMILLEFIKSKFLEDKDKKILVIDEAWRVLKNQRESAYIEGFARTFRKSNGSLLLITQSVAELEGSPEGKAYLANSSFIYVLKTEGIILEETAKLFGLNDIEKQIIANARPGEGILIWGKNHHKIQVKVDPKTHELITTNPEEVKKIKERKKNAKKR